MTGSAGRDFSEEESSSMAIEAVVAPARRKPVLLIVLWVVFVAFCGVLVFVWVVTKRVNPVMLDQQGHPIGQSQPQSQPSGGVR